jgi:hypothetical protein
MKIVISVFFAIALAGCGAWDRSIASVTGISRTCVDGVLYLQFTSGASVAYDADGKVKECK